MSGKRVKIAAGLAFADYGKLADQVTEAESAGADYIHADACDMFDMPDCQLMGGPQVIRGIREHTKLPIECHAYLQFCDYNFVDDVADAGADMLILPSEYHMGAPLAYLMARTFKHEMKFGLTLSCFTPLVFVEEAVYEIDRLHIVVHGVRDSYWSWRRSQLPMVRKARELIDSRNPNCELCVDGGIRAENVAELIEAGADVVVNSRRIFQHEKGISAGVEEMRNALDKASGFKL